MFMMFVVEEKIRQGWGIRETLQNRVQEARVA
jgi:hypothetical protein